MLKVKAFIHYCSTKYFHLTKNLHANAQKASPAAEFDDKNEYEAVIGLEIHAQLATNSKLFSSAATGYLASVNTNVSHFDCALPGTLPVLNKKCVELGVMAALALNCEINLVSLFDRKHYFYSDLPAGYQITQLHKPLAVNGWLEYPVHDFQYHPEPILKRTAIQQVQLEQDSGKSVHDLAKNRSLIDLNRAGIGLVEIVTHHDFSTAVEAFSFVKELLATLRAVGACDGKMDRGQLRVDANVSVRRPGEPLGPRTEVKNLNSLRFVRAAIEYEIKRHINLRNTGKLVINETLHFDYRTGRTVSMRDKEVRQDYRYMPEPNLPPLILTDSKKSTVVKSPLFSSEKDVDVHRIREAVPENLPVHVRQRWMKDLKLSLINVVRMTDDENLPSIFERMVSEYGLEPSRTAESLNTCQRQLHYLKLSWESIASLNFDHLAETLRLRQHEKITVEAFLQLITIIFEGDKRSPTEIVEENDLYALENEDKINSICDEILSENQSMMRFARSNPKKLMRKLVKDALRIVKLKVSESKLEEIFNRKLSDRL